MKKIIVLAAAAVLALALAGCSSGGSQEEAAPEEDPAAEEAAPEDEAVAPEEEAAEEGAEAGMANPWTEVASAEEAAASAGIEMLSAPAGTEIDLGGEPQVTYSAMEGVAEVVYDYPASRVIIRKGVAPEDGDISGDYNEYALEWTQNIKGLEITCYGNREDAAMKTIWTIEGTSFAILAEGLGGDTDFGLSADQLNSLINALQ